MAFDQEFNESLKGAALPGSLFRESDFRARLQSPEQVVQCPVFRTVRKQRLDMRLDQRPDERVTWPSSLQTLTFGNKFNFGDSFNHDLDRVTLPSNLQTSKLHFGFSVQPKSGACETAERSSRLDFRVWLQPKPGTCDVARQASKFDLQK